MKKKVVCIFMSILMLFGAIADIVYAITPSKSIRIAILDERSARLPHLDEFDILLIDGVWFERQLHLVSDVRNAMIHGIPTVMLGGNVRLIDIVDELLVEVSVGIPLIAQAIRIFPGVTVGDKAISTQLLVGGFNVTREEVISRTLRWAFDQVLDAEFPLLRESSISAINPTYYSTSSEVSYPQIGSSPYWDLWWQYTILYLANPYGNLNITHCWHLLYEDGSNTYAWFNLVTEITSDPGKAVYGSDWRTADVWNSIDADYFGDPNRLVDHGPQSVSGVSSVNYNLGVESGKEGSVVTCKMPITYSADGVSIHDQSELSKHLAKWWHDVPEQGNTGMHPYTIRPGATIRFLPIAPLSIFTSHQAKYAQPNWFWGWLIPDTWTTPQINMESKINLPRTINIVVLKAGDSSSSWVSNTNDVKAGVLEAINDANTRTRVKIPEQINVYEATSTQDLLSLVLNPPLRAVIVNTHGETIPMPNQFFGPYIRITSPSDGQTIYYSQTVYANVYPPPGTSLQLCQPSGYTDRAYVWVGWYRQSTGTSNWLPMYPNSSSGGTYNRYVSLPAYDTYQIYVVAAANYYVTVAHITVYYQSGGGGGGCPYLSVWNGTHYVIENNLLRGGFGETDIMDYYKAEQIIVPENGVYRLQLSEFEEEHDFIDQVKLLTVDHPSNVNVAVSPYGEILTYTCPYPPVSAITNDGKNVKGLLSAIDGNYYEGYNGSFIVLNFGKLDISQGAKLVIRADMPIVKVSIHVQVQSNKGSWDTVAKFIPRRNWATEIIDMSKYLTNTRGNLKVRLYFTANHKIDFVGLDTSPQEKINVQHASLLSVEHDAGLEIYGAKASFTKTTLQNMLHSDNIYAELTPGYRIQMNFTVPEKDVAEDIRDYIFVIEGRYKKAGSPIACYADWQLWFDLLEACTRNYGWVWANVAGYSFYYFGNSWYEANVPAQYRTIPGINGLKQFLSKDTQCYFYDGHLARRGYDFLERTGFDPVVYDNLPTTNVAASRPLPKNDKLPWNTIGYVDTSTDDRVTASITMNASSLDNILTGIFIHNGFSAETSDWIKGYIAAMLAIEESRAFLVTPKTLTQTEGNVHAATFSVTMLPGGWGEGYTVFPDTGLYQSYRYVDLMLTISTHYEDYWWYVPGAGSYYYSLSEADYILVSADTEVWAEIWLHRSGQETGDQTTEFLDDLGWWFAGLAADVLGGFIDVPYLGSVVGLIPILTREPQPPNKQISLSRSVWANRTSIDPNEDCWGSLSFYFRVIFRRDGLPRDYQFTLGMASWMELWIFPDQGIPIQFSRYSAIVSNIDIEFTVTG